MGTVVRVAGSTLVMKAQSFGSSSTQSVTVNTTSSTTIIEAATGSVSQIKTGDHLVIQGTSSATNVTATQIDDRGTASSATGAGGAGAPSRQPPAGATGPSGSTSDGPPSFAGGGPEGLPASAVERGRERAARR